jgi:hypothetical protein
MGASRRGGVLMRSGCFRAKPASGVAAFISAKKWCGRGSRCGLGARFGRLWGLSAPLVPLTCGYGGTGAGPRRSDRLLFGLVAGEECSGGCWLCPAGRAVWRLTCARAAGNDGRGGLC